jgi:hypothetical protein
MLEKWTRAHIQPDGRLDMSIAFEKADAILDTFLKTDVSNRSSLNQFDGPPNSAFKNTKPTAIALSHAKGIKKHDKIKGKNELVKFFNALGRMCMVTGLSDAEIQLSIDRTIDTDEYSWDTCMSMGLEINLGKHLAGGVFSSKEAFDTILCHPTYAGLCKEKVTVKLLRPLYAGMIDTYYQKNRQKFPTISRAL